MELWLDFVFKFIAHSCLAVCLLLNPDYSWANSDCGFLIFSNDSDATIEVDNISIDSQFPVIFCKDVERDLVVTSSSGEVFKRRLPSLSSISNKQFKKINIIFGPGENVDTRGPANFVGRAQLNSDRVVLVSDQDLEFRKQFKKVMREIKRKRRGF